MRREKLKSQDVKETQTHAFVLELRRRRLKRNPENDFISLQSALREHPDSFPE